MGDITKTSLIRPAALGQEGYKHHHVFPEIYKPENVGVTQIKANL